MYLHKGNQGCAELHLELVLNFGRMNKTISESEAEIETAEEVKLPIATRKT
jgi:hypothetical protein